MNQNDRALLQERVRTLVLRHALEAALNRLSLLSGAASDDELDRLEHAIVSAARNMSAVPNAMKLSAMVAVEDAVGTIRAAFDSSRRRAEAATVRAARGETAIAA